MFVCIVWTYTLYICWIYTDTTTGPIQKWFRCLTCVNASRYIYLLKTRKVIYEKVREGVVQKQNLFIVDHKTIHFLKSPQILKPCLKFLSGMKKSVCEVTAA